VFFEIIGVIAEIEVIASGRSIRELQRLHKLYGKARWRKMKGFCDIRLKSGSLFKAELHWYEAHGIGRKEIKIKRLLDRDI